MLPCRQHNVDGAGVEGVRVARVWATLPRLNPAEPAISSVNPLLREAFHAVSSNGEASQTTSKQE